MSLAAHADHLALGLAAVDTTAGRPSNEGRSLSSIYYLYGNLNLHLITDGKAAAPTLSLLIPQPPPGHDPVRVSYPWAPMC